MMRRGNGRRGRCHLAALLLLWAIAAPARESGPAEVQDEAGLDALINAVRPAVCAQDEVLCRHLKAFSSAVPPCFPQGERLTVGHASVIAADATVTPAEYFALRVERVRDVMLVRSQHVYSENEEEKQAAEDLVHAIRADAIDPDNGLYRYLESRSAEIPQLLAQREQRALVVRREGPALYLRQAGKLVYAAVPDATIGLPGKAQGTVEGLLFAVLPAVASCQ